MDKQLSLGQAAYYSVQIQGILDQHWADEFGDLRVYTTQPEDAEGPAMTTVVGRVADQAALAGLLNLVYTLQLPLLSVSYLGGSAASGQ